MRTVCLLLLAASAWSLPPEWDRKTVTPFCPFCGSTMPWGYSSCSSCQAAVEWKLPSAPESAEEAWRFLATAVAKKDRDFIGALAEGDAAENERALAIAPLALFTESRPVEGGERVVVASVDKATTLALTWAKGKFAAAREAHRPLKNQLDTARLLKSAVDAELKLREGDLDGNGQKDFWTRDWSGLARLRTEDGKPIELIPAAAAAADLHPVEASPDDGTPPRLGPPAAAAPFHGYRFAALDVPPGGFAFIASPSEYGLTGWLTFVVSEDGAVWGKDLGQATGRDDAPAPPTAGESAAIDASIRDLGAEEPEAREAADAKLRALGRKPKAALEAALPAANPEAKRRLRAILERIGREFPDLRHWPGPGKDLLDAGWEQL